MIDIATLESGLDVIALLEHWSVDADLYRCGYGSYRSNCFLHNGDGWNSLAITLVNGRYTMRCYSHGCHMSLVDYGLSTGRTFVDILRDYEMFRGESDGKRGRANEIHDACYLLDNVMDRYDMAIHKSYIDLGFDRDMLLNVWNVRYCSDPNDYFYGRVVYPIRDRIGRIRSIQGRRTRVCGANSAKYAFLPGYPAKDCVFGLYEQLQRIRYASYIVLTESPKSSFRGYQLGTPTLSTLGITYTDAQIRTIASLGKPIVAIADNDPYTYDTVRQRWVSPGIDGMRELAYALRQYVPVRLGTVPDVGCDVADYRTRRQWDDIIRQCEVI